LSQTVLDGLEEVWQEGIGGTCHASSYELGQEGALAPTGRVSSAS
jgi:hypothetical protein